MVQKLSGPERKEQVPSLPAPEVPSEVMRSLGIVQTDDHVLHEITRPFDLPDEVDEARRVVTELHSAAERVSSAHLSAKGEGFAAPQIGISRAAAIVRPAGGDWITLLNPVVVRQSRETDEQYEGCLSFLDIRGMVPRPLSLYVEHQALDGQRHTTVFERGLARLVAHEIDHLNGLLYTGRMRRDVIPIPVSEYRQIGHAWQYGTSA